MIWGRLQNLWKMSEYEIPKLGERDFAPKAMITPLVKRPKQEAQFIPRIKEKPIDKITKIAEENAN